MKSNCRILTICILAMLACCLQARTYVVSVGISSYRNIPSLRLPENDATAIAEVYEASGCTVATLLGQAATKQGILNLIRKQFSQAKADDQIVFFFSGHGYQGGVCPYDMSRRGASTGLSYKEIKAALKQSAARQKIVIADACFAGGLREGQTSQHVQNDGDKSVILFLSSRGGEPSRESKFMVNGIFTSYLTRGLRGGADTDRDKCITAHEIFTFVSNGVKEKTNDQQHPVMWGSFDDQFVLMDWRTAAVR